MRFQNVPLRWKLFGLAGLPLGLLTVEGVLELTGKPGHGVTIVLLLAGYLLGGAITLVTVRQVMGAIKKIDERLDSCAKATSANLLPALQALAAGDLTVELHASTAGVADFAHDELGQIMRHIEIFRSAVLGCYDAYNQTAEKLRELIGSVAATAHGRECFLARDVLKRGGDGQSDE